LPEFKSQLSWGTLARAVPDLRYNQSAPQASQEAFQA
jgi:hypothetical protein